MNGFMGSMFGVLGYQVDEKIKILIISQLELLLLLMSNYANMCLIDCLLVCLLLREIY